MEISLENGGGKLGQPKNESKELAQSGGADSGKVKRLSQSDKENKEINIFIYIRLRLWQDTSLFLFFFFLLPLYFYVLINKGRRKLSFIFRWQ